MSTITSSSTAAVSTLSIIGASRGAGAGAGRQSLLLLALLAVCTAVLASSSGTCQRLALARVVVFIPPVFRLSQSLSLRRT